MFCYKCGTQIDEGAAFCHKCGIKVVYADTEPQDLDTTAVTNEPGKGSVERPVQEASAVSPQTVIPTEGITDYGTDFKAFVDSHVRQTTKFQSAEELLNTNVPQKFMWICFGIPAILGLIAGGPLLAMLFGLFFGYPAVLLTDFMKGSHVNVTDPIEKPMGRLTRTI